MTSEIKDIYSETELKTIGLVAEQRMAELGHDKYQHFMRYEDGWFEVCNSVFPEKREELVEWIQESSVLPGPCIDDLFYRAELKVFGATLHEYNSAKRVELLYSGFCVIRLAMNRADAIMGRG